MGIYERRHAAIADQREIEVLSGFLGEGGHDNATCAASCPNE
jgi:hypothetical protein